MCGFAIEGILQQLKIKTMNNLDELITNEVESKIEVPFVTPNFGDNWKKYAEDLPKETLINIAWKQGRKAILLERLLRKLNERREEKF
jgi:hypothetical protein